MSNRLNSSHRNGRNQETNRLRPPTVGQHGRIAEMEQAAEESSDPHLIKKRASRPGGVPVKITNTDKIWFLVYGLVLALLAGWLTLLHWKSEWFGEHLLTRLSSDTEGAMWVVFVLAVAKGVEVFAFGRIANPVARFNLKRIFRLIVVLAVGFITISVLFVNWYTAVVSLGLISLLLGFALQTPISSFIGWVYILARAPYRVGDRIKIGDLRGDVIDVSYLDTTLWEFGGQYLSTDHPSGRVIRF